MQERNSHPGSITVASDADSQELTIYNKWIEQSKEEEDLNNTISVSHNAGLQPGQLYFCGICSHVWERAYCDINRKSVIYKYCQTLFKKLFIPKNNRHTVCPCCVGELDSLEV
jgi:hypothetical protein